MRITSFAFRCKMLMLLLQPHTVLSGSKMQDSIEVQLLDGWGFPAQQKGVKILLGKESALKLTPNPGMLLTDDNGYAKFSRFTVSAKRYYAVSWLLRVSDGFDDGLIFTGGNIIFNRGR